MSTNPVTVLPAALKAWRKERCMSQQELADRSAVSAGLIGLIETGRRQPGLLNLIAMADALDVSPHALAVIAVDVSALVPSSVAS